MQVTQASPPRRARADVRDGEPHLGGVDEDGLPRLAHRVPATQKRPAGMDALDVSPWAHTALHLREVERLERVVEARVRLLDLGAGVSQPSPNPTTEDRRPRAGAASVRARPPGTARPMQQPAVGLVQSAVGRADEVAAVLGEEFVGPEIERRAHVGAAIDVRVIPAVVVDDEAVDARAVTLETELARVRPGGTLAAAQRHSPERLMRACYHRSRMARPPRSHARHRRARCVKTFRSGWLRRRETAALRGAVARRPARRDLRPARAERRRQDHAPVDPGDAAHARRRLGDGARPRRASARPRAIRRRLNMASGNASFVWSLRAGEVSPSTGGSTGCRAPRCAAASTR